jgi:hypothetical protein
MMPHGSGGGTPMPRSGVSSPGRYVDTAPAQLIETRPAVLRFPRLTVAAWYRTVGIMHARADVPERLFRMAGFLSRQRVDRLTGRILGRWGDEDDQRDGGMQLAERYACVYDLDESAFWADWAGLRRYGLAERVVAPAPGRKAVYALILRADAIPNDLPEDLARKLGTYDLPEPEPAEPEGTAYGRLADVVDPEAWAEPVAVEVDPRAAAELAAAPRWEHPAGTAAAEAAEALAAAIRRAGEDERPRDLRCAAVGAPLATAADRLAGWLTVNAALTQPETSPLYREGSQLSGFDKSAGSGQFRPSPKMEGPKTTPSAAPRTKGLVPSGDPLPVVANRVMRRSWAAWRRELGRGRVILPCGSSAAAGERPTGSAWGDLHRTVVIALRRGATESELVELMTHNVTDVVGDVGRLAGWRLWRWINAHRDALAYRNPPQVKVAAHVTAWDEASPEQRERIRQGLTGEALRSRPNPLAEAARARRGAGAECRQAEAETERRAAYARWGISIEPLREPEHVMRTVYDELNPAKRPRTPEQVREAAIERARAEKRQRKQQDQARAVDSAAAARMRARLERLGIRPPEELQ